jgi:hypothetical protein
MTTTVGGRLGEMHVDNVARALYDFPPTNSVQKCTRFTLFDAPLRFPDILFCNEFHVTLVAYAPKNKKDADRLPWKLGFTRLGPATDVRAMPWVVDALTMSYVVVFVKRQLEKTATPKTKILDIQPEKRIWRFLAPSGGDMTPYVSPVVTFLSCNALCARISRSFFVTRHDGPDLNWEDKDQKDRQRLACVHALGNFNRSWGDPVKAHVLLRDDPLPDDVYVIIYSVKTDSAGGWGKDNAVVSIGPDIDNPEVHIALHIELSKRGVGGDIDIRERVETVFVARSDDPRFVEIGVADGDRSWKTVDTVQDLFFIKVKSSSPSPST